LLFEIPSTVTSETNKKLRFYSKIIHYSYQKQTLTPHSQTLENK